MIENLDNGAILITLGEGTVYSGIVESNDTPIGIAFTNNKGENKVHDGTVVFMINTNQAVASYIMAMVNYLEKVNQIEGDKEVSEVLQNLKETLKPMMPEERGKGDD